MNVHGLFLRTAMILLLAAGIHHAAGAADPAPLPENQAPKAHITATSEFSPDYAAPHVADGQIPEAGKGQDALKAWCVNGAQAKSATLTFTWEPAVPVREIVYYGRTAFFAEECFKDYAILLDDDPTTAAQGQFKVGDGPQRVTLPATRTVRKLQIRFLNSWGSFNPGAAEVQVFAASPEPGTLPEFIPLQPGLPPRLPYRESARDRALQASTPSLQLARDLTEGRLGFRQIVVIQRPPLSSSHVYTYHVEGFAAGGGLYLLTPDGKEGGELKQLVASPAGEILDCDVSYDGKEILFSWRTAESEPYQLFVVNADGSNLRQLTKTPWHNFNACWLPDGGIAFLSTQRAGFAYCWTSPVGTLWRMDRDGANARRLSANYLNDFTPTVTNDGQIMYGRWEYVDRPAIPIQSLWTINPDGTGLAGYYGNRVLNPATFIEPRAIPGSGAILCTMTTHNGAPHGAIGLIDPRQGDNTPAAIRNLTPDVQMGPIDNGGAGNSFSGPYENPCPVDEHLFFLSRAGTIVLRDHDDTRQTVVLRPPTGQLGFYSPQPLRPRALQPVRPSALPRDVTMTSQTRTFGTGGEATVFIQDVYNGLEPAVRRGEVKQIAVVQELEKTQLADLNNRVFGFQFPVVSCGATYAPKKIWGYATVGADGSASFKAPSGVPLYFMALDAQGRAVQRMRTFTHFMPGEAQGCIGCHENRQATAGRLARPTALAATPQTLAPPEWGVEGFSYAKVVQPVLDRACVQCHNAKSPAGGVDLGGDMTDFFNVSYETLARQGTPAEDPEVGGIGGMAAFGANRYTSWIPTYNGLEENILKIQPKTWGSPVSKLAEIVLTGHPDAQGKPRVTLDEAGRRRILTWIDLNVPYYGTSRFTYGQSKGCRRLLPADLDETLQRVAQARCASCHNEKDDKENIKLPRKFWVRVTHPELNTFLLAPLAREAGGTQVCGAGPDGQPVFKTTADPDYQAILATFNPVLATLERQPRLDSYTTLDPVDFSPGGVCPKDVATCPLSQNPIRSAQK